MTDPRPILVPVDFSRYSEAALVWAAEAAKRYQASLLVLHVVHDPESAPGSYLRRETTSPGQRLEETAADMLAEFLTLVRRKHPEIGDPETRLVVGLPATRILEVATETGARMIIMGSQGRTGLQHLLLGSKAEQVVRLSEIPVTIIKTGHTEID